MDPSSVRREMFIEPDDLERFGSSVRSAIFRSNVAKKTSGRLYL
jgi:hypothetical protein